MIRKYIFFIFIFLYISCKHDLERPTWDIDILLPLINSEMTINNMITDSNISINENEEGLISLEFKENFINFNLDSLIRIDAIADEKTHTLDSAKFKDVVISDTATIGNAIHDAVGPLGTLLLPDGSTNNIPAIPNVANEDSINIDASEYFETMTLYKGLLILEIINNYPTDISNVSISLINAVNQNIVATFSFPTIPKGSIISDSVSIAGQTLDENLIAILHNMDINASNGPVMINYEDAIITNITVSDIGITEATAIFPEQQLTETLKEHNFNLGSAQIKELGIKSGTVTIYVLSTLPNGKMVYNIPSLNKNGIPFTSGDMIVPEATNTNLTSFEFNFEGYILDLTGKSGRAGGDTINTIYTEAYTFIDSTGELITLNYTDSFYSYIEFNLTPEYAIGYLGQDTINFGPEKQNIRVFNKISATNIDIENVNLDLKIENFIGAEALLNIKQLGGSNNTTNENVSIIENTEFNIKRALLTSNNSPIIPSLTQLSFNADKLLEILPNEFYSEGTFYLNPNGQTYNLDFLYPEYTINASMNISVPLNFIAKNLCFIDTSLINLPSSEEFNIQELYLNIQNGIPFDANIELILLNENNMILDTLLNNSLIPSAETNSNNIVSNITESIINIEYSDFSNVHKIISKCIFNTKPNNEFISIYSDYKITIGISAKIEKEIGG